MGTFKAFRRVWAGMLAAALVMSLAQAQSGPGHNPDQQSARANSAQVQKGESFTPNALGKNARAEAPGGKTRHSLLPWIIGGVVVAGGIAAYFLFLKPKKEGPKTGEIYVESYPAGAAIDLDGIATGKVSNVLLTAISPGSHTVKLSLDGYRDYAATVTVAAGKRVLVQTNLEPSAIAVTAPVADTFWVKGDAATVRWTVDAAALPSSAQGAGVLNVKIELFRGGTKVATISESTPNDGSEAWTVPATIDPAAGYIVRVSCVGLDTVFGTSSPFIVAIRKTETFSWSGYRKPGTQFEPSGTARAEFALSGNGKIEKVVCTAWLEFQWNVLEADARLSAVGLAGPGGTWQPMNYRHVYGGHDSNPVSCQGEFGDEAGTTKAGKWTFSATYRCPCYNPDWEGYISSVNLTLTYLQWQ